MKIRKFTALVMTGLMAASLAACSDSDDEEDDVKTGTSTAAASESELTEEKSFPTEDVTVSEAETASAEDENKLPDNASGAWTVCDESGNETGKVFVLYKDLAYGIADKDDLSGGSVNFLHTPDPDGYIKELPLNICYDEKQVRMHDYSYTTPDTGDVILHDCYESFPTSTDAYVDFRLTSEKGGEMYMALTTKIMKRANLWLSSEKDEAGNFINYRYVCTYFDYHADPVVCLGSFAPGTEINLRLTILPGEGGRYTGQNEYIMVQKTGYHFCELDTDRLKKIGE
ncbi:MAG: hypothetical protein IKO47_03825 [Ruminococcus sp.]|nr:hypothetical protein [Ruminococcus sp.]